MSKKTWTLQFSTEAKKKLKKLDRPISERIIAFFHARVLMCSNPRQFGKPLLADLRGYWSYRIGDYRVICDIRDDELVILAVEVGHRRDVYDFDPNH